ncbi:hypothetical protein OJAV_G00094440 [Oryzias javanicus]|uniref:Outer dense fiber protein 2 n=1 Tax=Oryzias javanicus TaxID=123683 RepID=A0A3S2MX05_ORYJA|nr:hypothetical protein OJAV_G00094440 [Oryzias javanicus]
MVHVTGSLSSYHWQRFHCTNQRTRYCSSVYQASPVHVHMGRNPSSGAQSQEGYSEVKHSRDKPKVPTPWIPPGRSSCRRNVFTYKTQTDDKQQHLSDSVVRHLDEPEGDAAGLSKTLLDPEHRDTNKLLRTLVESEIDGVAVANQLSALKETIDSIDKEKRLSKFHTMTLRRHQKLLHEKMATFDRTNRSLRDLLRGWSTSERETLMWSVEKDGLKKRVADTKAENIRLVAKLTNTEKEASKLAEHLDLEKCHARTTEELSRVLESTRSHLEIQLSDAQRDKAQLMAQIQRIQQNFEQKQEELQFLQEELRTVRQKKDEKGDKEELQQLSKRAEEAEESAGLLTEKLREKELRLSLALSASQDWCFRHSKEAAAKVQLEEDISDLKLQVEELSSQLRSAEGRSWAKREELEDQLHLLSAGNASTQLENHRLKSKLTASEQKLRELHSEARHLKSSIKKYEALVEKYRKKVQQSRLESDHFCLKLEAAQRDAQGMKGSLERAKEQVRLELQELEILPEKLRRTEQQLQDAKQEAEGLERRNQENSSVLSEFRYKVEEQGAQIHTLQQKNLLLLEENHLFKDQILHLDRKLNDLNEENKELMQTLASKENSIHSLQLQLEEKTRECRDFSKELQQTLTDSQRQVDDTMQRLLAAERASQSKALEMHSQLSRARTELSHMQLSREEMERRFQSQLQNMKERLEHSDSTNRTLQNYVQFLKASYGNVFGDSFFPG